MFLQRIRVRFRKQGDLRAISHLDLMRCFERALRRAGLPLRMTEGFNPHPRISFPTALGVGIESLDEVMEFDLADWVVLDDVAVRLRGQLPEGLDVVRLEMGNPHRAAQAREVEYRLAASDHVRSDPRWSHAALESLLARGEIPVTRKRKGKDKSVDIRPFILAARLDSGSLMLRLRAGNAGSVHPEEVLGALGFNLPGDRGEFQIVRTKVLLDE